jgi:tetratricopeptide (TPR) repeat protein
VKIKSFIYRSFLLVSINVYATNNDVGIISKSPVSLGKPSAGEVKSLDTMKNTLLQSGIIESNTQLSVKFLDECWDARENLNNQKIIADYLMTTPKVPYDYETAWKTARLVYFIGNYGAGEKRFVEGKEGVKLFHYGAEAGKKAYTINSNKVEGYYWYAIDLGSYGLAKGILSAAANASDGMDALKKAKEIDPSYHWYGSSRILGRYYQELPTIFGGSSKKALALFLEATDKSAGFDNNWVFLGQFYNSRKEYAGAIEACKKALELPQLDGKFEEKRYRREAKDCIEYAKSKLG